jgi:hypothetical protein
VGAIGLVALYLFRRHKGKKTSAETDQAAFAAETKGGSGSSAEYRSNPEVSNMTNASSLVISPAPSSPYPQAFVNTNWSPSPAPSGYMDQQMMAPQFQAQQTWSPAIVQELGTARPERPMQEMPGSG